MQALEDVLEHLEQNMGQLLKEFPVDKKEMLQHAGAAALGEVQRKIQATGMADGGAKVSGWQRYYVGSHLGYTAVRAMGSGDGAKTGPSSPGAITNYTEHGHKVRKAGKGKRRLTVPAVRGYHFYASSDGPAQKIALEAAQGLCEQVAKKLMEGIS